jgi:EAL domain-containing protein (putative c-di-GMP-specific phosphodiesterase class I)
MLHDLMVPIATHRVDPCRIRIEVTESMLMENNGATKHALGELQMHGVTLAIDDFGTGYSSLAYIRDFPFDQLKIDRSFIHGVTSSAQAIAIVEAVVNFGRILGKDVVAEGIETEEEMALMLGTGCTHLQGFLFAQPMRADEIEELAQSPLVASARARGQVAKRSAGRAHPGKGLASVR